MPGTSPWTRGQAAPQDQSPKSPVRAARAVSSRAGGYVSAERTSSALPRPAGARGTPLCTHAPSTHPRAHGGPARAAYLPMMATGPAAEVAMPAPDCPKAPRARAESAAPGAAPCRFHPGRTVTHAHWLHANPGRGAGPDWLQFGSGLAPDWLGQDQEADVPPRDSLGAAVGGASTSRAPTRDAGLGQNPPGRTSRGHGEGKREDQTPGHQ